MRGAAAPGRILIPGFARPVAALAGLAARGRAWYGRIAAAPSQEAEQPLRAELFSSEQMKSHGRALAQSHVPALRALPDRLLARLADNERVLIGAFNVLAAAVKADRRIAPAGEWLLDNFYLIEEQVRTARRHFPKGYSRELPRLGQGPSAGLPRVYDIALEIISHGDGRVDPETLADFVTAYQGVVALRLGELWAIPIMLRLALLENLRRVGTRIAADRVGRDRADHWADQMTEIAARDPKSLILVIADMARSQPATTPSFVAEFARRLQGQSPALALPLTWIEQRLAEAGRTIEQSIQAENRQQAADQVSISNSIGSLRFLEAMDWREFVESMSVVEAHLREDPHGVYAAMDFATRDRYRHVVEKTARAGSRPEPEVARVALRLARAAGERDPQPRQAHVGYYLVDEGLAALEAALGVRLTGLAALRRLCARFALPLYLGGIALISGATALALAGMAQRHGIRGWVLAVVGFVALLCASQLGVALVNWLASLIAVPRLLPRMDFSAGIPASSRTLVVVPTLLGSGAGVERLLDALEVRFLANRGACLHFGLLTDWRDAPSRSMPGDDALVAQAASGIAHLNAKYPGGGEDSFFLFHRPRRWNAQDAVWMGYERKRGKLADLNALLRGDAGERFCRVEGRTAVLAGVKYVITLDTDTQLPRDAARRFVGAMAHPLNRAQFDPVRGLVSAGYGILQPRVAASMPGPDASLYARLCGTEPGIDPYTRAISDVYQDLFGEGSFIGKGIYDVDAFEQALKDRFPDNRILSHDLLEGCYVRSGLMSDVQVHEEDPGSYGADVARRYRWIRGDWQLARWLMPGVPGADLRRRPNPLSSLSRWKLFDNLRRSLVPAASVALLGLGWTVLAPAWGWTFAILAIIALPALVAALHELLRKPRDVLWRQHLEGEARAGARRLGQLGFALACLPFEAAFGLDAAARTTGRLWFTHARLLEWTASGDGIAPGRGLLESYRAMWSGVAFALAAAVAVAWLHPRAAAVAAPLLLLWLSAPALAWWLSRPQPARAAHLSAPQAQFLRRLARRTWSFFDTFVGPADHWLPPDNFQELPAVGLAHRTSPTNIGLALLANLSARDFGYLSGARLVERTAATLATMALLERHQGHFYNWYDTLTLAPLDPLYISTVDSGNLAGHLLTLGPGLAAEAGAPVVGARVFEGLADTFALVQEALPGAPGAGATAFAAELAAVAAAQPRKAVAVEAWLTRLAALADQLAGELGAPADTEAAWWALALARQCRDAADDLVFLAPWTRMPGTVDGLETLHGFDHMPSLAELARAGAEAGIGPRQTELAAALALGAARAAARIAELERLAAAAAAFALMEYGFLYEADRHLLAIGYNVAERRRDASCYDLLASEARLCVFVAIAQGQLPQESWFALGRLLTSAGGQPILVSWSGSMFEYLMPLLVMPTYDSTLLDSTGKAAVRRQIEYGRQRGVPWGISESGYNTLDVRLNYQYRAFGVPGLGLKRGLADDLVVAPYASVLALMVAPLAACLNLQRLAADGIAGRHGFYEAVDYTPARLPRGHARAVVRSFMAHHAGMSLLSLSYLLHERPMQRRFESDPLFRATTLLLQERVPRSTSFHPHTAEMAYLRTTSGGAEAPVRVLADPDSFPPEVQLLSNGRYHVMVSHAGGGYSRWKDIAVTRWREDGTCDATGTFCYVKDVAGGHVWSAAHQPVRAAAPSYHAIFSEGRAEFRRSDHDIDMHTEIAVSPEDDVELRRITITNRSRASRVLEFTSYAEVVLAPPAADALHPAFSNLFIQTEIIRERQAILCTRRPRSKDEAAPWMLHLMAVHGARIVDISYETDRGRFIGRGNGVADPAAMQGVASLSNTEGSVLDPIVAIRYRITLEAEQSATVNIVTGVAPAREAALGLVEKYQDRRLADRVFELAWTHSQVILRQINASEADAQLYARLAGSVIYANAAMRADAAVLKQNKRGQSGLWGYAISGDLPIVLLEIVDAANIDLVRQMVRAHAWWRLKGLTADLVVWNEDHTGYRQQLNEQIMGLIASGIEANVIDRPGGIFVRPANHISSEDRVLLQSVARAILSDARGPLADQINRRAVPATPSPRLKAARAAREEAVAPAPPRGDLLFDNGLGGFAGDGREYVITTAPGRLTPAPWSNVLANPGFGSVVSESGAAYTWRGNAHEFRLTPWDNDPVTDACGEAYYIRDEDSARFWSPMPLPARGATPYVTRHGFGYSVFEHVEHGIASEAWVYVAREAAVKYTVIRLRNASSRPRRLSLTGYAGWVLGDLRERTMMHVATAIDAGTGAIFATNSYSTEFAGEVAFFDAGETPACITCDRLEFIGRNGRLADPAALHRERLSGRTGHGADPCAAIQIAFDLAPGAQREVVFILGAASGAAQAGALVKLARGGAAARAALDAVRAYWRHTLGAVQVQTPDPMLDLMANGWLLYQTLACRLWARSGYYQSGGAFGFRDQLQDTMALVHAEPALARAHLVLCAGRQFEEGDVQHWWHPPAGRGVRTHCADDFLWLPLATCRYVTVTGDTGVLDEKSPFLTGRALGADADSYYDLPGHDDGEATLYDHCVRAIEHGLRFGAHGLPLIGSGDWNDGMNMVGAQGRGESVWLGFFMYQVLERFGALAGGRGDAGFAARCREQAALLAVRLEAGGWDGAWYRRAYFDDGTPLGSAANAECRIDSVSQSWAVLSGAGEPARARMAMAEVDARLVRREASLVQLLDPPFDKSAVDPGYIKGYVPGVRENGGQYTHAAIWAAMAFAALGDDVRAWEVAAMINPMRHALSPAAVAVYKVEPYVVAADVYAMAPHTGRGGWTWYTGSAGWMYRLLIESLLGLVREGDRLRFMPCLPAGWPGFTLRYRHGGSAYRIAVTRAGSAQPPGLVLDGVAQAGDAITLVDDGGEHEALLCLPAVPVPAAIAPAVAAPAAAASAVGAPEDDTTGDGTTGDGTIEHDTPAAPAPALPTPA